MNNPEQAELIHDRHAELGTLLERRSQQFAQLEHELTESEMVQWWESNSGEILSQYDEVVLAVRIEGIESGRPGKALRKFANKQLKTTKEISGPEKLDAQYLAARALYLEGLYPDYRDRLPHRLSDLRAEKIDEAIGGTAGRRFHDQYRGAIQGRKLADDMDALSS